MDVAVLGPLLVTHERRPVEIRRPMERALLCLLAAHPGERVSADTLVDGLWGAGAPVTATRTLHTYVYRLRSRLPEGAVATEGAGYRLEVPRADVDAWRFADTVTGLLDDRGLAPAERADRLGEALREWRGMPFTDVAADAHLGPVRARLEDLRLHALGAAFEAQVRVGRHQEVLPELHALLEEHPLREDLWATYALGLYRSGRQADALRALSTARRTLAEELGVEPGPELQRLQERVLAQDADLQVAAQADGPPEPPTRTSETGPEASAGPDPAGGLVDDRPGPERRLATVLVAELLGTEVLEAAAGGDVTRRVTADTVRAVATTVEQRHGTVLAAGGRRVVAVFGAPVARDDDVARAIQAALSLQEVLADAARQVERSWPGVALVVRAAVHTGPVTVAPGPALLGGDPPEVVSEAEQLLVAVPAGSVLVSDRTRALVTDLFVWGDGHGAELPGWRVERVRGRPGKASLAGQLRAPFIGRDAELAAATLVLETLGQGMGGVLLVTGEAGVGKSRLVEELRRSSPAAATWVVGHCAAYAEATPYWPVRDLLRSWLGLGHDPPELKARVLLQRGLEELFPDSATELYPYLGAVLGVVLEPEQARRLDLAPEALQYRTFEALATLLGRLAESAPVVAVVEDLHWADTTSLQLLHEQLLGLTESTALLLVLTRRPEPDHGSSRVLEAARGRLPHLTREVELGSLDPTGQQALLAALIGDATLPAAMERRLLRLAEGNPFYLEELVGSLVDEGALAATPRGWSFDHEVRVTVPETVERVVHARIDRLPRAAHELLTAASVLGRSFGLPLLQGVAGPDRGLVEALNTLLRAGLLVQTQRWPESAYVFKHALIQEGALRALPDDRRRSLHRRAAEWLEDHHRSHLDEVAGMLAEHWTGAGDDGKAVQALLRAGSLARREHALDEAVDHYRRLLPILERRGDRTTTALVLFRLALSLHGALRFAEADRVYQQAFAAWEPAAAPPATRTLRYAGVPFFRVPDPVRSFIPHDILLQMALFDRLVERWPDDTIVPSLAERWEISDDGLRYTFRLREGLVWSDGHPLTAGDVEFGLKRNLDPDHPGMSVSLLYVFEGAQDFVHRRITDHRRIGVRALDDRTVEFRLVAPAPYLLGMLNRPDCGPQPRHHIERHGEHWAALEHEVVSGAFHRVTETPERVELERRPDYQGHRSGNVRRVQMRLGDAESNREAFETGEVDLAWTDGRPVTAQHAARSDEPPAGLGFLVLNHSAPLLADRRLRLALAHGIDRSSAGLVPEPDIVATGGVVPPALAGHTPDIAPRFDPRLGRELLAQVPGVRPLTLAARSASRPDVAVAQGLCDMWREHLGLEVDLAPLDPTAYRSVLADGVHGADLVLGAWYPGYPDPEYFLRLLLHSEAADNDGRFADPELDDLIERARRERDGRSRLELFHRADRRAVAEVAAVIPVSYFAIPWLRRPTLQGWWQLGKSWASFADLTLT